MARADRSGQTDTPQEVFTFGTNALLKASRSCRPSSASAAAIARPLRTPSKRIEQIAEDLKAVGCDIISLSGTPPVLLKGLDFEREWRDRLSQKLALPVVSQMEPHALALVALGVKRVAIATYYGDELNNAIKHYFSRSISRAWQSAA